MRWSGRCGCPPLLRVCSSRCRYPWQAGCKCWNLRGWPAFCSTATITHHGRVGRSAESRPQLRCERRGGARGYLPNMRHFTLVTRRSNKIARSNSRSPPTYPSTTACQTPPVRRSDSCQRRPPQRSGRSAPQPAHWTGTRHCASRCPAGRHGPGLHQLGPAAAELCSGRMPISASQHPPVCSCTDRHHMYRSQPHHRTQAQTSPQVHQA